MELPHTGIQSSPQLAPPPIKKTSVMLRDVFFSDTLVSIALCQLTFIRDCSSIHQSSLILCTFLSSISWPEAHITITETKPGLLCFSMSNKVVIDDSNVVVGNQTAISPIVYEPAQLWRLSAICALCNVTGEAALGRLRNTVYSGAYLNLAVAP